MKKRIWLLASLLLVVALLAVGCSSHAKGMDSPRWLTDAEKEAAIDIALATPAAAAAEATYGVYTTDFRWAVMYWYGKHAVLWWMDYDAVDDELPPDITGKVEFYLEVIIRFGEPTQEMLRVALNPDTGKIVYTSATEE
jgi:hypothetical protein